MNERYNRQIILTGFGNKAQEKLTAAKVLVIGAGGLGCPALQYLAASGIGKIGLADDDTVALSNLQRQVLYTTADIGRTKVEVAAERLTAMNPQIEIRPYPLQIRRNNIIDLIENYDIIFDGTDNFETRYLINDACALLNKPLVFAAVFGYEGQLAIFNVKDQNGISTNYRDLFATPPKTGEIPNCVENGVIGVLPGIIGTLAAAEIIKLITGIGKPLINTLLTYNMLNLQHYQLLITPAINNHSPSTTAAFLTMDSFTSIDAKELSKLQQQKSTITIDVREELETPLLDHTLYLKAPMSKFDDFLKREITEEHVIFICAHGIRSVTAAEAFNEKYGTSKKAYSLKGGIARWANELDLQT